LVVHRLAPYGKDRIARVRRTLEDVGLTPADAFIHRRPYELSGGQRQRVAIAAALVLEPTVLLADEPVSMLDVSVRAGILNLLNDLHRTRGLSILFVTHDVSTAAVIADRVAVMYLGRIVEVGPCRAVLGSPVHPYTVALVSAVPVSNPRQRRSRTILQGDLPDAFDAPDPSDQPDPLRGCRFHPRCPVAFDPCRTVDPSSVEVGKGHLAACLRVDVG
jgi:oligopeptide/dipeptide ABC transporter ATP-binding protein